MSRAERYFIGPGIRDKLRDIIVRTDGTPIKAGGGEIPTRLQTLQQPSGSPLRLGKTTVAWTKGTLATIELYNEGTPPNETKKSPTADVLEDCVNKFADVQANKWVMLGKVGNGYWYLIAAEC